MTKPVVATDGHSYEASAIRRWFVTKTTSPVTGKTLNSKKLVKNHALAKMIRDWVNVTQAEETDKAPKAKRMRRVK